MSKKLGKNDNCWCGSNKKYKNCHLQFDEKIAVYKAKGHIVPPKRIIKNPEQIEGIRESCKINIEILDRVSERICVGIPTQEIDMVVRRQQKH